MTTMLEKMAGALYAADCRFANGLGMQDVALPPWDAASYAIRAKFYDAARAALQAIREPTEAMLEAADDGVGYYPTHIELAWPDAIDAILEGKA